MELEEMKSLWEDLSVKVEQQEKRFIWKEVLTKKSKMRERGNTDQTFDCCI